MNIIPALGRSSDLHLYVDVTGSVPEESIARFAANVAPEVFTHDARRTTPFRLVKKPSGFIDIECCLTADPSKISFESLPTDNAKLTELNLKLVDLGLPPISKTFIHSLTDVLKQEVLSAAQAFADNKNIERAQKLLSFFADKNRKDDSLESVVNSANEDIDVLKSTMSQIDTAAPVDKKISFTTSTPTNTVSNQEPAANTQLKTRVETLEKELIISNEVLKDAEARITSLKRNNTVLGPIAGATAAWASIYALDQNKDVTTAHKLLVSAFGGLLGFVPYTRYATIALSPIIVKSLINSGVIGASKKESNKKVEM